MESTMESKEASEMVRGLEALQALSELEPRCTRGTFNLVDAARLLAAAAPKSHKDWAVTERAGDALVSIVCEHCVWPGQATRPLRIVLLIVPMDPPPRCLSH